MLFAEFFGDFPAAPQLRLDFVAMIPVVRHGGVNIGHRELRKLIADFMRRHSAQDMPYVNIQNTNPASDDAGLRPVIRAGAQFDMLLEGRFHSIYFTRRRTHINGGR